MVTLAAIAVLTAGAAGARAQKKTPAEAGENVSFPGTYVRVSYNDEGWVTLGFRLANESVGEDWMLLQVGMTVQGKRQSFMLHRDNVELVIPGPKVVSLASQEEFGDAGGTRGAQEAAEVRTREEVAGYSARWS